VFKASMILVGTALALIPSSLAASPHTGVQRATERGKAIYLYDRAGWITADDLATRLRKSRHREIGGWVVTTAANGLHVQYFGKDAAADRVIYSADVSETTLSNAQVYPMAEAPLLQEPASRMARALRAAWAEMRQHREWQPCTNARFNTVVLPPQPDGAIPVYFLTPQTELNSFPFGGHYEIDIGSDGRTGFTRAFTRSCITMAKPSAGLTDAPAMLFLTHLLDPHPTEIHVFEQYQIGVPLVVGTGPRTVWKVENGTVEDISNLLN
jgi:hypothetical protein